MRVVLHLISAVLIAIALTVYAQEANLPAPGTRGNADNVPHIGGRDPGGNPVRLAKATGHVSNYAEDKVAPFTLPDPLVTSSGERVTTAEMWRERRRPEILKLYQTEIYGRIPANAPKVTWEVTETDNAAREGAAIMKRVVGRMGDRPDGPKMNLTVYLPAKANGPVPMLLSITFGFPPGGRGGNAAKTAKSDQPKVAPKGAAFGGFDSLGEVLGRGWGYATLGYTDIQPDRADQWTSGVIGLTLKDGQTKPAPDEWGTISAWAWGISRSIDFLETEKAVNPKQIAITGASRLGKTVLWASAQDERVAAVFSVVSGEMGASLIRRDWGETLDDMAQNFSWQFSGNMQKWVGRWNDLPIDQHMLIALSAPRPVYVNGGLTDQWSDPKGEFLAMVAAGPVYRLLGKRDLGTSELPALDTPLTSGELAYHYHSGGHQAVPADWKAFLDFAERHFKAAQ
jgi:(4-O-methyl)-D-glucuronate---lignin esterase